MTLFALLTGMHRTELTASDIAELEKERKGLQLTTTDYLLKVNEIRTKKGVDLLENLLKFYQSQVKYFQVMTTLVNMELFLEFSFKYLNRFCFVYMDSFSGQNFG